MPILQESQPALHRNFVSALTRRERMIRGVSYELSYKDSFATIGKKVLKVRDVLEEARYMVSTGNDEHLNSR
jgi:hypothetical protein